MPAGWRWGAAGGRKTVLQQEASAGERFRNETGEELVEALEGESARMAHREEGLRETIRQTEVAMLLLQARGRKEADPAWQEQAGRRQAAAEELARLREAREEAARLQDMVRRQGQPAGEGGGDERLDERLRLRVRTWLLRCEFPPGDRRAHVLKAGEVLPP